MDPAGVKFGLSRNLLQLDGGGIVMAADVLDAISELARRQTITGIRHRLPTSSDRQWYPAGIADPRARERCRGRTPIVLQRHKSCPLRYADRTWRTGSYRLSIRLNLPGYGRISGRSGGQRFRGNRRGGGHPPAVL